MNQSLAYAQGHPAEVRALRPPLAANVRLPIWTTIVDRAQLLPAREVREEVRRDQLAAELHPARAELDRGRQDAAGDGRREVHHLRQDGNPVTELKAGKYTFVVTDTSKTQNFQLVGPGVNRKTSVTGTGRSDLVGHAEERHLPLQLERPSGAEEDDQGHVALPTP